jgi:hypothetical protein
MDGPYLAFRPVSFTCLINGEIQFGREVVLARAMVLVPVARHLRPFSGNSNESELNAPTWSGCVWIKNNGGGKLWGFVPLAVGKNAL